MDWSLGLELWSGVLEWILGVEPWSEISSVTENSILVVKFFSGHKLCHLQPFFVKTQVEDGGQL